MPSIWMAIGLFYSIAAQQNASRIGIAHAGALRFRLEQALRLIEQCQRG